LDIVTIDFETFYDKDYSLSRITTEEYVRSDLFETIGVSVKVNEDPGCWYSGNDVHTFLNSLDYSDKAILCHHTAFDGAILSWHYDIKPKLWLDTLSMARPKHNATVGGSLKMLALHYGIGKKGTEVIDAKGKRRKDFTPAQLKQYGNYCINDGGITWKLFKKLKKDFPVSELMVIDQTIRMYTEPVLELNRSALEKHLLGVQAKKRELLAGLGGEEAAKKVLMSNPKFAELLEKLGTKVPMKVSPSNPDKETYAFAKTDQGLLDLLGSEDDRVIAVVEARMGVKSTIEETRTQRLIDVSKRGPLPIMLNYYGAHTGRFSGGDKLNLQNIPVRQGNAIRSAIVAPEGHKVVACDSSQIEARILAFLAKQIDLVEQFRLGHDVYQLFADDLGVSRFVGKTCILGLGYGMGSIKFEDTLKRGSPSIKGNTDAAVIDDVEAKRIVYYYRSKFAAIKGLWSECDHMLTDMVAGRSGVLRGFLSYTPDGIKLPNDMLIRYNGLCQGEDGYQYLSHPRDVRKHIANRFLTGDFHKINWTNIYGGKVTENIVQALARIVVSEQATAIKEAGYPVVLQVHDENVCVPVLSQVNSAQQVMENVMSTPPSWATDLPVACESAVGGNYGECK
jgi:DNA polymerase I-like protein with 3'-5' exonuclease and polymerase domains